MTSDTQNKQPTAAIRHEWYQTPDCINVSLFIKDCKQEQLRVDSPSPDSVTVELRGLDGQVSSELKLHPLFQPISSHSFRIIGRSKVEIILTKQSPGVQWPSLIAVPKESSEPSVQKPSYPSSSKKHVDWSEVDAKVAQETANDKPEGADELNDMFQKIYRDADDATRRAMVKSFQESGGTTLSTNWEEVGKAPVSIRPPDSMEYRKL